MDVSSEESNAEKGTIFAICFFSWISLARLARPTQRREMDPGRGAITLCLFLDYTANENGEFGKITD